MDPKVWQDHLTELFAAEVAYFNTVKANIYLKPIQSDSGKANTNKGERQNLFLFRLFETSYNLLFWTSSQFSGQQLPEATLLQEGPARLLVTFFNIK